MPSAKPREIPALTTSPPFRDATPRGGRHTECACYSPASPLTSESQRIIAFPQGQGYHLIPVAARLESPNTILTA